MQKLLSYFQVPTSLVTTASEVYSIEAYAKTHTYTEFKKQYLKELSYGGQLQERQAMKVMKHSIQSY